jgi:hypothetical protein
MLLREAAARFAGVALVPLSSLRVIGGLAWRTERISPVIYSAGGRVSTNQTLPNNFLTHDFHKYPSAVQDRAKAVAATSVERLSGFDLKPAVLAGFTSSGQLLI